MREKIPLIIFVFSLILVLINDTFNYYEYKKIETIGKLSKVYQEYNSSNDNYDYYFKTFNNKIITVSKSYNNKKFPNKDKFLLSAQVIYNPNNPENFNYFPFQYSLMSSIKKITLIGIILIVLFSSLIERFFRKYNEKDEISVNFEKYANVNNDKFKWILKKHPIFNLFILNQFIGLFYVFGFSAMLFSIGFSSFNVIGFVLFITLILVVLISTLFKMKFILINENEFEVHYWFLPKRKKNIKYIDIKEIKLNRMKGQLSINVSLNNDKMILSDPFSNNEINDLYKIITELKKGANNV